MTTTDFPKIKLPAIASRLKNGAWVLAAKEGRWHDEGIVLGFHGGAGAVQPFCVWKINIAGDAYWGNYFENLNEALEWFRIRV